MITPASVAPAKRGEVDEASTTPPAPRRWLSLAAGAGAAVISGSSIAWGAVPEVCAILVVGVLMAIVPSAPALAPRIALNSALVVGWAPLLWWVPWPMRMNHAALLIAVIVGGLTAWIVVAPRPLSRLRALYPEMRSGDALVPIAAVLGFAASAPFSLASSPFRALVAMLPGADNWAHFAMFNNIRFQGAIPGVAGDPPDGTTWAFENYPRGFHTLAATLSEIGFPQLQPGAGSVVAYAQATGLVVVLGVILVTASVLAIPGVTARPTLAVPAVALVLTALLWEPGQKVLANGFASFWLGAVSGGAALLLAAFRPPCPRWLQAASIGGLLVCVATTWAPLLIVASPAALTSIVRHRNDGVAMGRRARAVTISLVVLVGVVAGIVVLNLLRSVSLRFLVTEVSGFNGTSPVPTLVLLVTVVYAVGRSLVLRGDRLLFSRAEKRRLAVLLLAVAFGVGSLTALLIAQLHLIGTTSYYFLKYLVGFELILACVGAGTLAGILVRLTSPTKRLLRGWVAGAVLALAVTQVFVPLWQQSWLLFSESDDGTASIAAPYSRAPMARGILDALDEGNPRGSFDTEYLPLGPGNAIQPFYPDAWYHAAGGSASAHVVERMAVLRAHADDVHAAAPLLRQVLDSDVRVTVLVRGEFVQPLRALLPAPDRHRIISMKNS